MAASSGVVPTSRRGRGHGGKGLGRGEGAWWGARVVPTLKRLQECGKTVPYSRMTICCSFVPFLTPPVVLYFLTVPITTLYFCGDGTIVVYDLWKNKLNLIVHSISGKSSVEFSEDKPIHSHHEGTKTHIKECRKAKETMGQTLLLSPRGLLMYLAIVGLSIEIGISVL
ncbi:hypothetical protein Taro_010318, partial [Colocasia esculenta]|nr:hypothetical protein [Colocasia esculenta]